MFEQSDNPISYDYYNISKFKKTLNKQQDVSILHLNIFPFQHM